MLENSSWHESGVSLRDIEWRHSASLRGLLERAPPPLHALKSPAVSLLSLITLWKEMFLVLAEASKFCEHKDPVCAVDCYPLMLPAEFLTFSGHPITIVWWRILQDALVSPSQAPSFSLSSLVFRGWDTKSIRHLRLCSRLRDAIRIQNCVETLNIKSAEFHFHWYSSEYGVCLSYSEQFNREGASAKLTINRYSYIETVPNNSERGAFSRR